MRHITFALVVFSTLAVIAIPAGAVSLLVYPDGSGTYATIQAAVDASLAGDTIVLMPGVYTGPGNRDIVIDHDLNVEGSTYFGEIAVTLDLEGAEDEFHRAFRCEVSDVVIEDLAIINGYANTGGAISIEEGYVIIRRCLFRDNTAVARGGAIYTSEECITIASHCMFGGNVAGTQGGACFASGEAELQLTSCSLVANGAADGSAVYLHSQATCDIERTIIAFGHGGAACDFQSSNFFTAVSTNVYHNAGGDWTVGLAGLESGTNNNSVDPQFVDPMGEPADYRLSHNSPCGMAYPGGLIGAGVMDETCYTPTYNIAPGPEGMFGDLAAAVAAAPEGALIVLEAGTHQGSGYQDVEWDNKDLVLRGRTGQAADCTIDIDGNEGDRHCALIVTGLTSASRMEGLTFRNGWNDHGGAMNITGPSALGLAYCAFIDNTAGQEGGAISGTSWNYDLAYCVFEGNHAGLDGTGGGGALDLRDAVGTMDRCSFVENASDYPAYGCAGVDIYNTSIDGPIIFQNCDFIGNEGQASGDAGGGALSVRTSGCFADASFSECRFEANYSSRNGGAAYFKSYNGSVTFENCEVADNEALQRGGGLALFASQITLSETVLSGNYARGLEGGGVYIGSTDQVDITECRFEDNQSECSTGGGIHFEDVDVCQITDTLFEANQSGSYGGILWFRGGRIDASWCSFRNNISESSGAGFYLTSDGGTAVFDFDHCVITGNSCNTYGCVVSTDYSSIHPCEFQFSQCTIHGNSTSVANGRVFLVRPIDTIVFDSSLITNNDSPGLIDCRYSGNPTTSFICSNLYNNSMGDWVGYFAGQYDDEGNMSADPRFCDAPGGNFTLQSNSPCLPDNNACASQVGARGLGCDLSTGVQSNVPTIALGCANYPNPFNPQTTIAYALPTAGQVTLAVYDTAGRLVRMLETGLFREAGQHSVVWDGCDAAGRRAGSGVYLARMSANGAATVRRMVMLK